MAVSGIPGAEDATMLPGSSIALISSSDRLSLRAGLATQGAIFALDVNAKNPSLKNLTDDFKQELHPHGISLYATSDGKTLLFVINHRKNESFVEIFEYVNGLLEHRESISSPLMWRPNDLQAVGPRRFYVSNDHGSQTAIGRFIEDFMPLRNAYVLYFDGTTMAVAAKDIGRANGVNISGDGKTLYVAATTEKAIRIFARDIVTGVLTPGSTIPLGSFPDNIEVDDGGNLYVAVMPKALTYMEHSRDANLRAPTQILKVMLKQSGQNDYEVVERYVDDGRVINAATVAAPFRGGMLLGPSKDKRDLVMICRDAVDSQPH